MVDVHPAELLALVVTALAWNAFAYGLVLYISGSTNAVPIGLIAGGAVTGLVAAGWLVVVYQVRAIVGG